MFRSAFSPSGSRSAHTLLPIVLMRFKDVAHTVFLCLVECCESFGRITTTQQTHISYKLWSLPCGPILEDTCLSVKDTCLSVVWQALRLKIDSEQSTG